MNQEKLLTSEEVAEHLRVSVKTIENWRARNIGPAYIKMGTLVRYKKDDVDRYLDVNHTEV